MKLSQFYKLMIRAFSKFGFIVDPHNSRRISTYINAETEFFVYPYPYRKYGYFVVDPIVGFENSRLRTVMIDFDKNCDEMTRVAHFYASNKISFSKYIDPHHDNIEELINVIVKDVVNMGVTTFSSYDSLEKVRDLLWKEVKFPWSNGMIIFDSEKKAIIADNIIRLDTDSSAQ